MCLEKPCCFTEEVGGFWILTLMCGLLAMAVSGWVRSRIKLHLVQGKESGTIGMTCIGHEELAQR